MMRICTIDTGASSSLLRSGLEHLKIASTNRIHLRTATGERVEVIGKARCKVQIGGFVLEHEFIVADIVDDVIIGSDLLLDYGFIIDLENYSLSIEIPLVLGENGEGGVSKLSLVSEEKIPA